MKRNTQELSLVTILTALIAYTGQSLFLPILLIFPVNPIIIGVKRGIGYSILPLVIGSLVGLIFAGPAYFLALLALGLTGLVIAYFARKGDRPLKAILMGAGVLLLINILVLAYLDQDMENGILDQIETTSMEAINKEIEILEETMPASDLDAVRSASKDLVSYMLVVFPSALFMTAFVYSLVNYYLASLIIRKQDGLALMAKFSYFTLPADFGRGIILVALVLLILNIMGFAYMDELFLNIIFILVAMFTIQGIAVTVDILGSKSMLMSILLNIFLFITGLSLVLTILGIIERIFHLRLRWRQKNG